MKYEELVSYAQHPLATTFAKDFLNEMARRVQWAKLKPRRTAMSTKQRDLARKLMREIDERKNKLASDSRPKDADGNILIDANVHGWTPSHPVLGAAQRTWLEQHSLGTKERCPDTLRSVEEAVRGYLQGPELVAFLTDLARSWDVPLSMLDELLGQPYSAAMAKGRLTTRRQVQALLNALPGHWKIVKLSRWYENDFGRQRRVTLRCGDQLVEGYSSITTDVVGVRMLITRTKVKRFAAEDERNIWKGYSYPCATRISLRKDWVHCTCFEGLEHTLPYNTNTNEEA